MKKPQDDKEAVKFHRLYAEQGVVNAQFRLAQMYYEGLGVEQDYKEAVKWFRLVAEQGDAEAQRSLGEMYDEGQGVLHKTMKKQSNGTDLPQNREMQQHNTTWDGCMTRDKELRKITRKQRSGFDL